MNPTQTPPQQKYNIRQIARIVLYAILALTVIDVWSAEIFSLVDESVDESASVAQTGANEHKCNVAGITVRGTIDVYPTVDKSGPDNGAGEPFTASDDVVNTLETASKDLKIKAALIDIDSTGGFPVAAEEIANALKNFGKPTVAVIHQSGLSSAYWASTGADMILASANSDIGSIGVTQSYLQATGKNAKEGFVFQELNSGKYKDMGSPDKPLTAEERAIIQRDLNIVHENFIKAVAENRKLDINAIRKLADGSSMMGGMALGNKLIDQIGSTVEAKNWLKEKIGADPEICW